MGMHRNNLVWGGLLVLLGGLLLLDNLGLLPRSVNIWGIFWPLALIGLGVSWVWGALRSGERSETLAVPLEATERARVLLRHGAGELRIAAGAGAGQLLEGVFGGGVISEVRRSGGETRVDLRVPDVAFTWPMGPGRPLDWQVNFSSLVALALEVEGGASRMILDLRDLRVYELRLKTGASATMIEFPENAGETRAFIESGAASVDIRVPEGVAAHIRLKGALGSANVDEARFHRVADGFESGDYVGAVNRLDLEVQYGVGSVTVR